jgi:hypothetical protein
VAYLALFVALGGTSVAAVSLTKNSVKRKHIAPNAVNSAKVKNKSLRARDFAPGQLPKGERGDPGAPGQPGAPGSPAASALMGSFEIPGAQVLGPRQLYAVPNGVSTPSEGDSATFHLSPNAALVARDLSLDVQIAGNGQATLTLRSNATDTALSCTVTIDTGAAIRPRRCANSTALVAIPASSAVSVKLSWAADVRVFSARFGWRATTP